MANKALFHLLVIFFLALSNFYFFPSNASRVGSLMEKPKHIYLTQQYTQPEVEKDVEERKAIELNDYPGSGANNRHVPRQQYGRGCVVDC